MKGKQTITSLPSPPTVASARTGGRGFFQAGFLAAKGAKKKKSNASGQKRALIGGGT